MFILELSHYLVNLYFPRSYSIINMVPDYLQDIDDPIAGKDVITMKKPTIVTSENFEQEVLNATGKILVDFWADWCGPCRMLSPIIEEIASEHEDIKVCKVNVDEETALAQQYNVMSIPMVIMFENGKIAGETVGFQPKDFLLRSLEL